MLIEIFFAIRIFNVADQYSISQYFMNTIFFNYYRFEIEFLLTNINIVECRLMKKS